MSVDPVLDKIRKPFIEALTDLYSKAIPSVLVDVTTGTIVKVEYPESVEQAAQSIRDLMQHACIAQMRRQG